MESSINNDEQINVEDLYLMNDEDYVKINSTFMYVMIVMNGYNNHDINSILKEFNNYRKESSFDTFPTLYNIKVKKLKKLLGVYPNPISLQIYKCSNNSKVLKKVS